MANLFPQRVNIALGAGTGCIYDVLWHPDFRTQQLPLIIFLHGGGGTGGDHYACWGNGGSMNRFLTRLSTHPTFKCNIVSAGTAQYLWSGPTTNVPYLPTVVNPTTPQVYPVNVDVLAPTIDSFRTAFNPSAVFVAAVSWGAMKFASAMMRGNINIDGLITYYLCPDIRASGGVDSIYWTWIRGWFGTLTQSAWNAIATADKQQASFLYHLETANLSHFKPLYNVFDKAGMHVKPYGLPDVANSLVHDSKQYYTLRDALLAANVSHVSELLPQRGAWETELYGDPLTDRVVTWMIEEMAV